MPERGLPFDAGADELTKRSRIDRGKGRNRERESGREEPVKSRDIHSRLQLLTEVSLAEHEGDSQERLAALYGEITDFQERASKLDEFLIQSGYPGDAENETLRAERVSDLEKANLLMRRYQPDTDESPLPEQLAADKEELDGIRERFAVASLEISREIDQLQAEDGLIVPEHIQALLVEEEETSDKEPQEAGVDTRLESRLTLLETKLHQWRELRSRIDEAAGAPERFDQLMAELPVIDLAKKHELKKKERGIELAKRELAERGELSDPEWLESLEGDLDRMIPAGEILLERLKRSTAPSGVESAQPGEENVPEEELRQATALLHRWDELRQVVGENRLLKAIQDTYPDMELPHMRRIALWVTHHREPKAWQGRWADKNREQLVHYLEQLEGMVGDGEKIASQIGEKADTVRKSAEPVREEISFEEALPKLGGLLTRWRELRDTYGDTELRYMIFQDRQGDFAPVDSIVATLQKQSELKDLETSEKDWLVRDALPQMKLFIARAEAAAKKLEPKKKRSAAQPIAKADTSDPKPEKKEKEASIQPGDMWEAPATDPRYAGRGIVITDVHDDNDSIEYRFFDVDKIGNAENVGFGYHDGEADLQTWLAKEGFAYKGRKKSEGTALKGESEHHKGEEGQKSSESPSDAEIEAVFPEKLARTQELLLRWRALGEGHWKRFEARVTARSREARSDPRYKIPNLRNFSQWLEERQSEHWSGKDALQDKQHVIEDVLPDLEVLLAQAETVGEELRRERLIEERDPRATEPTTEETVTLPDHKVITLEDERKKRELHRLVNTRELDGFTRGVKETLQAAGITNSVILNQAAKDELEYYMPRRIRQVAVQMSMEITDEEMETLMVSLRSRILVT